MDVEEEVKEEDLHNDAKDLKPKLAANIEKARVAMSRLEEIFANIGRICSMTNVP